MHILLTESTCKECQTKLSHYEITEKGGLCISCYKEQQPILIKKAFVIPKKTTKKAL